MLAYRPDVDGLRALAVGSVVAYHFDFPGVSGGFLGVDVFFVISGFLITSLITRELDDGSFTIADFYKRRVRRIFPALLAMLAVVSVAGVLVMFASDLQLLRTDLLAATFFASNVYFWRTNDYFAAPAADQPLLHTWSLSVEEQFYLLFPLLLLVLHRRRPQWRMPSLWLVTGGSFVLCVITLRQHPQAAFYLLPQRAWELGAGALLAVNAIPAVTRPRARDLISAAGLLLVLSSVLGTTAKVQYAWPMALLAVLGSVALIHAGPEALAGRALSLRPVVFLGLLSYSLYLWHWPVLVLYRDYNLTSPGHVVGAWLAAVSLLLALLSWRYVERPFRRLQFPSTRRLVVVVGAALSSAALVAGLVPAAGALLNPMTPQVHRLLAYESYERTSQYRAGTCFIGSHAQGRSFDVASCLTPSDTKPNFLVMGDSHAADLWRGLQRALPEVNVMQATASGCQPVDGTPGEPYCTKIRDYVLHRFLPTHHVSAVILSARWSGPELVSLVQAAAALKRYAPRVIVLGPHVEYAESLPKILARGIANGDPGLAQHRLLPGQLALDGRYRAALRAAGIEYVSLAQQMCHEMTCREYAAPGVPMQSDYGHLTAEGADLLGRQLAPALRG